MNRNLGVALFRAGFRASDDTDRAQYGNIIIVEMTEPTDRFSWYLEVLLCIIKIFIL